MEGSCGGGPAADCTWRSRCSIVPCAGAIPATSAAYVGFVREGVEVTVIRAVVEDIIPELPRFLSEAANAGHGSERKIGRLQMIEQIKAYFEATDDNQSPETRWKMVKSTIADRVPEAEADHLIGFAQKWAHLITETQAYMHSLPFLNDIPLPLIQGLVKAGGLTSHQVSLWSDPVRERGFLHVLRGPCPGRRAPPWMFGNLGAQRLRGVIPLPPASLSMYLAGPGPVRSGPAWFRRTSRRS